jgi:BNR/Asp-box repeat
MLALSSVLFAQTAFRVPYTCTAEDLDAFGLTCSPEEPCPIYAELSSVEILSGRWFVTGNLHTQSATLYGLLLLSDDGGKTWAEPVKRERWTAYESIQFADLEHGWIGGGMVQPLPKDPFLLITSDAGKTWRVRPLFEESRFGSIQQFWFDSAKSGELVFENQQRLERYESETGGQSWELKETSNKPLKLAKANPRSNPTWRLRADSISKTYKLEQRTNEGWKISASFEIHVSDCKGAQVE